MDSGATTALDRQEPRQSPSRDLRPRHRFPLIRHISWRVTLWLARTPITPNQISVIGPIIGLVGVLLYAQGDLVSRLLGVAGFFVLYLGDHCDGELARLTHRESRLGDKLSEIGGASFHVGLFLALGWKASEDFGNPIWLWLGIATAAAGLINLVLALSLKEQALEESIDNPDLSLSVRPDDLESEPRWWDKAVYAIRGLLSADLWIVFVVLGVFDLLWILLPPAAIAGQVYWIAGLTQSARKVRA